MSLRIALSLAMASCLALSTSAYAAAVGVYVQGTGGYTSPDGDVELENLEGETSGPIADVDLSLDDGYMAAVAVGYDWGAFRAEGEVAFRQNDFDDAQTGGGFPLTGVDGEFEALSLMVNGIFEIPAGDVVSFYVGAGAGIAAVRVDTTYSTGLSTTELEVETGMLAYQGLAGVAFNLTDNVALNFGYRIWSCLDTEFDDDWNNDDDDDNDNDEDLEGDLSIPFFHTLEVGLRYTF